MDHSPSSNKKRKSVVKDSGQGRRLAKKVKIAGDIAGTSPLSHSPSKSSFTNSPVTPSSRTARIPSGKNAKAGPSTQSRNPMTPIRVSSRVSHPTLKKKALLFQGRSRSPESDSEGTPPLSVIPPAPPPSLKRKRPTSGPTKKLAGNGTPSKSKWLDPNPIELTSSDDAILAQPSRKRIKHASRKPLSSQVIDLCSENEDVTSSPRPKRTRDEGSVVVVLSTDEEADLELSSFNRLAFRESDSRKGPALPPPGDISSPIEDESVFRASPSPQIHDTPVPKPKVKLAEEDVIDETNIFAKKVDFPRGSLQALYNAALARCAREPQHAKDIADKPSPFYSLKCKPPARIIRYSTLSQSPTLHTPLFFDRIILRLRARLKPRKTLDAQAIPDDISPGSMEVPKFNEELEDTRTYSDTIMEASAVDSENTEVATKTMPIESQDDALSGAQATSISPSILVNDLDVNERSVSKAPESPSPLAKQESPFPSEVVILEDTPVPGGIQAQEVSANYRTLTPERENSSAISPNILFKTPSNLPNPDAVIATPQETETFLFRRESADQIATTEPSVLKNAQFLVQTLRRRYDASKISGLSLPSALELNDTAKPSAVPEPHSESPVRSMEHVTTTNISSLAILSSENTSSTSKCLSESPMILTDHAKMQDISVHATSTEDTSSISESSETPMIIPTEHATTPNPSLIAGSNSEDASSSAECLSESPLILTEHATTPTLSSLASSSSADSLSSRNSSPSACSRQSSDSSTSIESVNCHLITPDDPPSPLIPPVKAQKREPFIHSSPSPSSVDVYFFDMDSTLMGNSKFDDDDDDTSLSGMELVYPEETI